MTSDRDVNPIAGISPAEFPDMNIAVLEPFLLHHFDGGNILNIRVHLMSRWNASGSRPARTTAQSKCR